MPNSKQPSHVGERKNSSNQTDVTTSSKEANKDQFLQVMSLMLRSNFLTAEEQAQNRLPGVMGGTLESLRALKEFRKEQAAIQNALEDRQASESKARRGEDKEALWAPKRAARPTCQLRFDGPFLDFTEKRPAQLSLGGSLHASRLLGGSSNQIKTSSSTASISPEESDGFLSRATSGNLFGCFRFRDQNDTGQSNMLQPQTQGESSGFVSRAEIIPSSSERFTAQQSKKRRYLSEGFESNGSTTSEQSGTDTDIDASSDLEGPAKSIGKRRR